MDTKEIHLNREGKQTQANILRILLIVGCILASFGIITSVLALTLPYWIHVTETMETTVAGLTEYTDVEYSYGLMRYCLVMKATHLDRDECGSRTLGELEDWELATFATLVSASGLLVVSIVTVTLNLRCCNKLRLLIVAIVTSITAGVSSAVGVSMYQIKASGQVLDIGGLTTANFKPSYLSVSFWLGFTTSVMSTFGSIAILLATFMWKRPKSPRKVLGVQYKTTVRRQHCPYRGREPGVITVTQM